MTKVTTEISNICYCLSRDPRVRYAQLTQQGEFTKKFSLDPDVEETLERELQNNREGIVELIDTLRPQTEYMGMDQIVLFIKSELSAYARRVMRASKEALPICANEMAQ